MSEAEVRELVNELMETREVIRNLADTMDQLLIEVSVLCQDIRQLKSEIRK